MNFFFFKYEYIEKTIVNKDGENIKKNMEHAIL